MRALLCVCYPPREFRGFVERTQQLVVTGIPDAHFRRRGGLRTAHVVSGRFVTLWLHIEGRVEQEERRYSLLFEEQRLNSVVQLAGAGRIALAIWHSARRPASARSAGACRSTC